MSSIKDVPVWCEACNQWFPRRADFQRHKDRCSHRDEQVDHQSYASQRFGETVRERAEARRQQELDRLRRVS